MESYDFDSKEFRVVKSEGPGASVTLDTVFIFSQDENIISVDYFGGRIKTGRQLGLLNGDTISFKHMQVTINDEFQSGESLDRIERQENGKLRLTEEWEWTCEGQQGTGILILEEV